MVKWREVFLLFLASGAVWYLFLTPADRRVEIDQRWTEQVRQASALYDRSLPDWLRRGFGR
jgi:hypothetical protein